MERLDPSVKHWDDKKRGYLDDKKRRYWDLGYYFSNKYLGNLLNGEKGKRSPVGG